MAGILHIALPIPLQLLELKTFFSAVPGNDCCAWQMQQSIHFFLQPINKVRKCELRGFFTPSTLNENKNALNSCVSVFLFLCCVSRRRTNGGGLVLPPWCAPSPCPPPRGRCQWLQSPPSPPTTPPPGLAQMGNTWFIGLQGT